MLFYSFIEKTKTAFTYNMASGSQPRTSLFIRWNVTCVFINPNYIMSSLYVPSRETDLVFSLQSLAILTYQ